MSCRIHGEFGSGNLGVSAEKPIPYCYLPEMLPLPSSEGQSLWLQWRRFYFQWWHLYSVVIEQCEQWWGRNVSQHVGLTEPAGGAGNPALVPELVENSGWPWTRDKALCGQASCLNHTNLIKVVRGIHRKPIQFCCSHKGLHWGHLLLWLLTFKRGLSM